MFFYSSTFLSLIAACNILIVLARSSEDSAESLNQWLTQNVSGQGLAWLEVLCDDFGHRKVGSDALEKAIDWMAKGVKAEDGVSVHTEPVAGIPNWVRRDDFAIVTAPRLHRLNVLAIDGSPPANFEADVVVFDSLDEIELANVTKKIVVLVQRWSGYATTVAFRKSAVRLAKLGAAAVLVNSVTPSSLYSPHTGAGARNSSIVAASLTLEEGAMLQRWWRRGVPIRIRIDFFSRQLAEPTSSRNVVLQINGTTKADEVVLLTAHVDTWDVGQGALDDGGGMAAIRSAMLAIRDVTKFAPSLRPLRTIRVVFFTAEEQGNLGAASYFQDHQHEKFVLAMETDQGAFRPLNFGSRLEFAGNPEKRQILADAVKKLNKLGYPLSIRNESPQGQIKAWAVGGVPTATYISDRGDEFYFRFHHSNADYSSVFSAADVDQTAVIFATVALEFANSP